MEERRGCSRRDRGIRKFNALVDNLEVVDPPMLEKKFTWCNSEEIEKWSRIDSFLLSPEWVQFLDLKVWGLPRIVSNHCPIILMEDSRDWGPRPFRFINAWCLDPRFYRVAITPRDFKPRRMTLDF